MDELKQLISDKWNKQKELLDEAVAKSASKEEVEKLVGRVRKQGEEMADILNKLNIGTQEGTFEEKFEEFLVEKQDELQQIAKAGSGGVTFYWDVPTDKFGAPIDAKDASQKAVGDMTTGSGGDAVTAPANHNTRLSRISFRDDSSLISACNVVRTNSASLSYTEVVPKEGGYGFVAEGNSKPQTDFQWSVRYAEPFKIAAYEVFTEEVVTDIPRMMDVARGHLKDLHDLYKANAIYFSDGTGGTPVGATQVARVFAAGDMALKVANPNFMDVVNAIITDIYTTPNYTDESHFQPSQCLVNPIDFYLNLVSAKDSQGHPLYPQASLFNQVNIGGVSIKPWIKIPAGKIFVGDMKKYNISNWVRYSVRIGWINDQFITNKFTMVGESRFHAFVKNLDTAAFVYDDIATVKTAITAP